MRARWLFRITLLIYLAYIVLLTLFASTPSVDAASRTLVEMALGLFLLWMASGSSPSYTAYL